MDKEEQSQYNKDLVQDLKEACHIDYGEAMRYLTEYNYETFDKSITTINKDQIINELEDILKILEGKKPAINAHHFKMEMVQTIKEHIEEWSEQITKEIDKEVLAKMIEAAKNHIIEPEESGKADNMGVVF